MAKQTVYCGNCGATGDVECPPCGGEGVVPSGVLVADDDGTITERYDDCPRCGGSGSITCNACGGLGSWEEEIPE